MSVLGGKGVVLVILEIFLTTADTDFCTENTGGVVVLWLLPVLSKMPSRITILFFFVFFCLNTKEPKNQGQTNAPPFVRPTHRGG